jgi:hypothetical protein
MFIPGDAVGSLAARLAARRPPPHPLGITIPRSQVMTPGGGWPWARQGLGGSTRGFRPAPLRNAVPPRNYRNV